MADGETLIARKDAMDLIRQLADRPEINGRRRNLLGPVLVVEGARGTGKSALLRDVCERLDQRAPYAPIDFAASPAANIAEVLSAVAFTFGRYCAGYGAIVFPRLAIARLLMEQTLDRRTRKTTTSQVTALLATERGLDTVRVGLGRAAGAAINIVQGSFNVPKELAEAAREISDGATRGAFAGLLGARRTRRIVLGKYVGWFGHRDRGMTHDPIDRLIDLNSWAADPEMSNHQQAIDELVWDAFLTDLREHFHSKDADSWRFSCVLLMDNVDSRIGQEFVTGLVRNRSTRREDPDPLAAVVTSTGELLASRDPQEIAEDGVADPGWRRFRRHRLSDLAEDDTINMIANTGLRTGHTPGLPIMIHQLTGGHPATTQLMITTVAEHESIRDQPLTLLNQLEPGIGPDRKPVAERIRANLLGEFPRDLLDELITCAAATDVEHLRWLADLSPDSERLLYQIEQLLWPPVGGAGPQVLRRLLLPLLAQRETDHPASWEMVFERLRTGRSAAGDEPGELYYALAVGDLTYVVAELEQKLSLLGSEEWSELLLGVSLAPRRLADPEPGKPPPSPDEQCRALLRSPGRRWPSLELARLVVGLWMVNDPMTDARRRSLHEQIADDYEWLAGFSPQDSVQCYRQSGHRHRRLGDLWPWN